ncbi:MAG: M4 family metallopeptidase [Chitinophagaceae bacterium]|nr:M4 family metallopeptidase [Chitinophagaceae bacterium]
MKKIVSGFPFIASVLCLNIFYTQAQEKGANIKVAESEDVLVNNNTFEEYKSNSYNIRFDAKDSCKQEDFVFVFKERLGLRDDDKFNIEKLNVDNLGYTHYSCQQFYKDVKVNGGVLLLHERDGKLVTVNGQFYRGIELDIIPTLSQKEALVLAKKYSRGTEFELEDSVYENNLRMIRVDTSSTFYPLVELCISPIKVENKQEQFHLSYRIRIPTKDVGTYIYVIDAVNGSLISKVSVVYNFDVNGIGQTIYSGSQTITVYNDLFNYSLRDYDRKVFTYDLKSGVDFENAFDFTSEDKDLWPVVFQIKLIISELNNNWWVGSNENINGGEPDLFFTLEDASENTLYSSTIKENTIVPDTFSVTLPLNDNGPYIVKIWDDDFIGDDLLGTFVLLTSSGDHSFEFNGTLGSYTGLLMNNPALDAHWGMEKVFDFYKEKFNRNSYNNQGASIKSYLNFSIENSKYGYPNNSYATEGIMVFGLGDNINFRPIVCLDVAGHEFTHLVYESSMKDKQVKYENESGALNESFSDIFGTAIEFYAKPNTANWTMGEEVKIKAPYFYRSLQDPNLNGHAKIYPNSDPYLSEEYFWKPLSYTPDYDMNDLGGVHSNSGVQNYWFYLLVNGGIGTNQFDNSFNVSAMGMDDALNIVYRNLTTYLSSTSGYLDAAVGSLNAAIDLFGLGSAQYTAVYNAWYAVNVFKSPTSYCAGTTNLTSATGEFQERLGSGSYGNNADCIWKIQPTGATSITLSFSSFDLLAGDTVYIYKGSSTNDELLKKVSGNTLQDPITANGSSMLVRFTSDASGIAGGFNANYTSVTSSTNFCSGVIILNQSADILSDGSGINDYVNNANCQWKIEPPGASSISLAFSSFDLQLGDSVKIYNGPTTSSPLIHKYSGDAIPPIQNYSTGQILVVFSSTPSGTASGWDASYTSVGIGYCNPSNVLIASSGTITDGSAVNNYYNNTDCGWLIDPLSAVSISLTFTLFDLELAAQGGSGVIYDWVKVFDGADANSNLIGTFTGTTLPPVLTSSGGAMYLQFHTDGAVVAQGWNASYTSIETGYCAGTTLLTSASGSLNDGSGTSNYGSNADCKWLIQPANALSIVLSFSFFDTELNYDGITVYDGSTTAAPVIGVFTGSTLPPTIFSNGGAMLVRFTSDNAIEQQGWSANYVANISASGGLSGLNEYEYWFDNNYADKISQAIASVSNYTINTGIPTEGLANGLHSFHIRFKDKSDNWSSVVSQFFQKLAPTNGLPNLVTAYRYWFNQESANMVNVNLAVPTNPYDLITDIATTGLPNGTHTANFQFKDTRGYWSSVLTDTFTKSLSAPKISLVLKTGVVCPNTGAVDIKVTKGVSPYTYLWSNGAITQDLTGLAPGTYTVTVTGANGASSTDSYNVSQSNIPKPKNLSATNVTSCSATLNWQAISGITEYKVRYRITGTTEWSTPIKLGNQLSYIFLNLLPNTSYDLSVASKCSGSATTGNYAIITSTTLKCTAPINITATSITSSSALISWTGVCNPVSYKINYKPLGGSFTTVNVTSSPKTINGLSPSTTYEYQVKAVCAVDNSQYSTLQSFTTSPLKDALTEENDLNAYNVSIYPNPTSGNFVLSFTNPLKEKVSVELVNILGQKVQKIFEGTTETKFSKEINGNELPSAMYYVEIAIGSERITRKLVIER